MATKRDFVINYGLQTDRTGSSTGNTLAVDQVNNRVGVNNGSPAYDLDVTGNVNFTGALTKNGVEYFASRWTLTGSDIYRLSKVGINESNPQSQLAVKGSITESTDGGTNYWNVVTQQDIGSEANQISLNQYLGKLAFLDDFSPNGLRRDNGVTDDVTVNSSGNVGVGIASANFRLDVQTTSAADVASFKGNTAGTLLTIDNNTLDDYKIGGVNTVSPFVVYNNTDARYEMVFDGTGNVLIGSQTASAHGTLQVNGNIGLLGTRTIRSASDGDDNSLTFIGTRLSIGSANSLAYGYADGALISSVSNGDSLVLLDAGRASATSRFRISNSTSNNVQIRLYNASETTFFANSGGNVGIGTGSPTEKLEVSGRTVITTGTGPFYGLKIKDYANSTGLYAGSVSGANSWYIGDAYYFNSNLWRTDKTAASYINFVGGTTEFYNNTGLTANTDYTPSRKIIIDGSGNLLVNRSSSTGTASQTLQVNGGAYISGDVGIGNTAPAAKLDVFGEIRVVNSGFKVSAPSAVINFSVGGSDAERALPIAKITAIDRYNFRNQYDGDLAFNVASGGASVEVGRFAYTGNFGIATTNPLQKLHVQGNFLLAADATTATHITQKAYTVNNGTLSWEGSAGQLFSITNNLTSGSIFSVNDVSGIPSIDVDANGLIELAPFNGAVSIGSVLTPTAKVHIIDEDGGQPMLQIRNFAVASTGNFGNVHGVEYRFASSGSQTHGMLVHLNENLVTRRVLDISNASGTFATFASNGNFGLGMTSPVERFSLSSSGTLARFASTGTYGDIALTNTFGGGTVHYIGCYDTSLRFFANSGSTPTMSITGGAPGNVGIGTTNPGYRLEVNGSFAATTKSFVIDHPTKEGMKLRYGSLEGPENGVYVRGKTTEFVIELPDYWTGLVDEDTITVNLTPFGKTQTLWVKEIRDNKIFVGSKCAAVEYFYTVFGERKDVEKLEVEF